MINRQIIYVLTILGTFSSLFAQDTIPFRITKNHNIIVKGVVNDTDSLDLMFQIASQHGSLTARMQQQVKSMVFDTSDYADGISRKNKVSIGKYTFNSVLFFGNEQTGHEANGKIGTGIFSGKAYKIDYDNHQFIMYDQLPELNNYQAIPVAMKDGQFFITVESKVGNHFYAHPFLLQSGFSGAIIFDKGFSDQYTLSEHLEVVSEKVLKNSAGESVVTKQGILEEIIVGNFLLKQVPAGYFVGSLEVQRASYFGADLLRRFNWIFDSERKTAYIQPNKNFNEPYFKING